jgi:hypothetical protein
MKKFAVALAFLTSPAAASGTGHAFQSNAQLMQCLDAWNNPDPRCLAYKAQCEQRGNNIYYILGTTLYCKGGDQSTKTGIDAGAGCTQSNVRFHPYQNDSVESRATLGGSSCLHKFTLDAGVQLTATSIVSKPKNGSLTQYASLSYSYVPKTGFVGVDAYSVRICASSQKGSGCSTISYQVNVVTPKR